MADKVRIAVLGAGWWATGVLSGTAAIPKHMGPHVDIRLYGDEGYLFLDLERERLEVRRFDGKDEIVPFDAGTGARAYSTKAAINRFVDLCLGRDVINDADGAVG